MWLRNPDGGKLTLRLSDASGQTHQIVLTLEDTVEFFNIVCNLKLAADEKKDLVAFMRQL